MWYKKHPCLICMHYRSGKRCQSHSYWCNCGVYLSLLLLIGPFSCRGSRERCEIVEALLRLMIPYTNTGIVVTDDKVPVLSLVQVSTLYVDAKHRSSMHISCAITCIVHTQSNYFVCGDHHSGFEQLVMNAATVTSRKCTNLTTSKPMHLFQKWSYQLRFYPA